MCSLRGNAFAHSLHIHPSSLLDKTIFSSGLQQPHEPHFTRHWTFYHLRTCRSTVFKMRIVSALYKAARLYHWRLYQYAFLSCPAETLSMKLVPPSQFPLRILSRESASNVAILITVSLSTVKVALFDLSILVCFYLKQDTY